MKSKLDITMSISNNRVMRSKVCLEFQNKLVEIVHPGRTEHRVLHLEEVRFEPLKGHALQVRLCEHDFGTVHTKGPWVILEV